VVKSRAHGKEKTMHALLMQIYVTECIQCDRGYGSPAANMQCSKTVIIIHSFNMSTGNVTCRKRKMRQVYTTHKTCKNTPKTQDANRIKTIEIQFKIQPCIILKKLYVRLKSDTKKLKTLIAIVNINVGL